jgi:hypothetical protein
LSKKVRVRKTRLATGLAGGEDGVPRAYAEVLRQLEPLEVLALDRLAAGTGSVMGSESGTRMGIGGIDFPLAALVNLERAGLIALGGPAPRKNPAVPVKSSETLRVLALSSFGGKFVSACRGPEPRD